uniref:Uncharacterized protein n=1 Tax=Vitis vinifera TaxID=29760 RepID=A5B3M5_VITVI|nr:hypothetical protein VITISV_012314 [Vitis vinifera]
MASQLRNSRSTLRVRLQTAITSSFQLQIAYHLKNWTLDFPIFETRYSMHNLSSRKCFKNVSNSGLPNGTRVPKGGFAAVKHPSKWRLDYEMEDLQGMEVSQPFRSCEKGVRACKMALVCQGASS